MGDGPKRRRTPSVPMMALSPTAQSPNGNGGTHSEPDEDPSTTMGPRTRDEVLLKTLARTERVDAELEILIEASARHDAAIRAVVHDQRLIASDVKVLDRKMDTVKGLLTDILDRLPERPPPGA